LSGKIKITVLCYAQDSHFDIDLDKTSLSNGRLVELAGVEPASESASSQTSPGADGYFGLSPVSLTIMQTVTLLWLGSFIMHGAGKAYRAHVLH